MNNCRKSFEEVKRASRIIYNPAEVNQFGNKFNIDFCTSDENADDDDIIFFNTLINEELSLRRLSVHGNLNDRRL
jgi:hypothetical protein